MNSTHCKSDNTFEDLEIFITIKKGNADLSDLGCVPVGIEKNDRLLDFTFRMTLLCTWR